MNIPIDYAAIVSEPVRTESTPWNMMLIPTNIAVSTRLAVGKVKKVQIANMIAIAPNIRAMVGCSALNKRAIPVPAR